MDQTVFSLTRVAETAVILKRFPASEESDIMRMRGKPKQLAAYLAKSNDLTEREANEVLEDLQMALRPDTEDMGLKAA